MFLLELTKEELQALAGLLDAGVRATGLRAITPETLAVMEKLKTLEEAPPADA